MRGQVIILAYVVVCAAIVFCYSAGVPGSFLFDDISNIINVPALHLDELTLVAIKEAALSGNSGILKRPVSVLTFALNYYFSGQLDPYWFKWTNILIHVFNSALVYHLVERIVRLYTANSELSFFKPDARKFALVVAALWALHPLHVSTVLYIVQRMTMLSATFSLIAMIMYLKTRIALIQGDTKYLGYMVAMAAAIILGIFSKENAALTALYIVAIEGFLFRFSIRSVVEKRFIYGFFGIGIIFPAALVLLYTALFPEWILDGYANREFTVYERLLTQARMIWEYVQWILLPNVSSYAMHHDDIALSRGFFNPVSTIWAILGLLAVVCSCFWYWKKLGLVAFGVIFFLVGHIMESTVIGLELVFEHRNYLPSLGLILAASVAVYRIFQMVPTESYRFCCSLVAGGIILVLSFSTFVRADKWSDPFYSSLVDVENHPYSARAHHTYAVNLMLNTSPGESYDRINRSFLREAELDPSGVGGLYGKVLLDISTKKMIAPELIEEFEQRLSVTAYRAETIHFLNDLIVQCEVNDCAPYFTDSDLRRLLTAARNNPKNRKVRPVDSMLLWVRYLITHEGNIEEAYAILKEGIAINPENPAINSYLLEIYALGKTEEERQQLLGMVVNSEFGRRNPSFVERLESRITSE